MSPWLRDAILFGAIGMAAGALIANETWRRALGIPAALKRKKTP